MRTPGPAVTTLARCHGRLELARRTRGRGRRSPAHCCSVCAAAVVSCSARAALSSSCALPHDARLSRLACVGRRASPGRRNYLHRTSLPNCNRPGRMRPRRAPLRNPHAWLLAPPRRQPEHARLALPRPRAGDACTFRSCSSDAVCGRSPACACACACVFLLSRFSLPPHLPAPSFRQLTTPEIPNYPRAQTTLSWPTPRKRVRELSWGSRWTARHPRRGRRGAQAPASVSIFRG